jgi:hypothetical protein
VGKFIEKQFDPSMGGAAAGMGMGIGTPGMANGGT